MRGFRLMLLVGVLMSLCLANSFAQQNSAVSSDSNALQVTQPSAIKDGSASTTSPETETPFLWGEVIAADPQNNEITVKSLDLETDAEKDVKVTADDKTAYENVGSLNDIKIHDIVVVDYAVGLDGRYIAKNISLEKPEETPSSQPAAAATTMPQGETPASASVGVSSTPTTTQ